MCEEVLLPLMKPGNYIYVFCCVLFYSAPPTPERMTPTSPTLSLAQLPVQPPQLFQATSQRQSPVIQSSQTLQLPIVAPPLQLPLNITEGNSPRETTPTSSLENSGELSPPMKKNKEENQVATCNMCDKSFSTPASLSMHKKIHSGERPHCCGKFYPEISTFFYTYKSIHSSYT